MTENNKTALITGATTGIGHALARCFAENGYNLVIVARSQEELDSTAQEIKEEFHKDVFPIAIDLFNPNSAKDIYNQVKSKNIQIDVLVNDAGQGQWGKFWEVDIERHLEVVQLNICSLISLNHLFLQDMIKRNDGKILNVGSVAGTVPGPLLGVYSATKAFVNSFSEALFNELQDTNVTVTVLMPGVTESCFWEKADARDTKAGQGEKATPESVAKVAFKALMKGEEKAIPGFMNNLQAVGSGFTSTQSAADNFRSTMVKTEE